MDPGRLADEQLLAALASGDKSVLLAFMLRHARGVYDFALRATLDEAAGADVVRGVFARMDDDVGKHPGNVDARTWLYSMALVEVLAAAQADSSGRAPSPDTLIDGDYDQELNGLAWQAARSLALRDYCVLDLTLRRGLTPEEVSEAASLSRSNLYASIGRARGAFEDAFVTGVLELRGRAGCSDVNQLLEEAARRTPRLDPSPRVAAHAEFCERCRKVLVSIPHAGAVLAALRDVDLPGELEQEALAMAPRGEPLAARAPVDANPTVLEEEQDEREPADRLDLLEMPAPHAALDEVLPGEFQRHYPGPGDQAGARYGNEETFMGRLAGILGVAGERPLVTSYALLGIAAVLMVYLGIAVADSLRPGAAASGAVPLSATPGLTSGQIIGCGEEPLLLDAGTTTRIGFAPEPLEGYQIGGLAVSPANETATEDGLTAAAEGELGIVFDAARLESEAERVDEYELRISWRRGEDIATSACEIEVQVPATP